MMLAKIRRARADVTTMNRLFPTAERLAHEDVLERPGAEHLVLASFDLDDRVAADALGALGVERDALRQAVADQHDDALLSIGVVADEDAIEAALPSSAPPRGLYRAEASFREVFEHAVTLAKQEQRALTSGHVLLAALALRHGTMARTLGRLAIDRDRLREMVQHHLEQTRPIDERGGRRGGSAHG